MGNPTVLWNTHQAVGSLLLKQDKREAARRAFQAAVKVVQGLAEDLTDVELKEGYLNMVLSCESETEVLCWIGF